MKAKPAALVHRPKDGTSVKISKIRGRVRLRKTANGYQVEFKAGPKTQVRYLARS